MILPPKGRILALDYGLKRIGLAVTDVDRTLVFPRPVLRVTSLHQVCADLKSMCMAETVAGIVIGLPYDDMHIENAQTDRVRDFGVSLEKALMLPVFYEDEKYTTAEADMMLEASGFDFQERKMHRDSIAAMLILQSFLRKV